MVRILGRECRVGIDNFVFGFFKCSNGRVEGG